MSETDHRLSYRFGVPGAVELDFGGERPAAEEYTYTLDEPIRGMVSQDVWFENEGYRYALWVIEAPPMSRHGSRSSLKPGRRRINPSLVIAALKPWR